MNKAVDTKLHVRGESRYVDDLPHPEGMLFAAVATSSIAHGKIKKLNLDSAKEMNGVRGVFTCRDVPGENQIGNVIQDEPLLVESEVHFVGQPIAVVVAETANIARAAAKEIEVEYKGIPAVFDPREAHAKGLFIESPRTLSLGDVDAVWDKCDLVIEGRVESGAQEHIYMETQSALAVPNEYGIKLISSTQAPTVVQRIASRVLGIAMHKVEVEVLRLGGAFGGKEDQATPWAVIAALAAKKLRRPVKISLRRGEDIRLTGKRHPYSSDYKIGLNGDGKIIAYEVYFYQNAGASADLSTSVLERSLFHATNCYFIPNVKISAASCKTNIVPNTAFRGFGAPQAMYVIESAIHRAADEMGVPATDIQRKNLIADGELFPYGQRAENSRADKTWDKAQVEYDLKLIIERANSFNEKHHYSKKGVAVMPICFGISFTTTFLNQASALVHVYTDGSIGVSTAAVEMGQGVNEKILGIAARVFSVDQGRVKIETTNTTRIANTSPTAASSGVDMNGHATKLACEAILGRMKRAASKKIGADSADDIELRDEVVYCKGKKTKLMWGELVSALYMDRTSLSAQAHYATPNIGYDKAKEKGSPFVYHVFGTAVIEATVDCLRGTYVVDAVRIVHDFGKSLNPIIDRGQVEGALLQGIGWMTMEEVLYSDDGRLTTDALSTYKIPGIGSMPKELAIHFLENADNPPGPFNSKAIGEPPFMYGMGAYFAILNAMRAFKPELKLFYDTPLTPEKVLMALHKL